MHIVYNLFFKMYITEENEKKVFQKNAVKSHIKILWEHTTLYVDICLQLAIYSYLSKYSRMFMTYFPFLSLIHLYF